MITTADKLRCCLRELGYRKHVYKRRVANGQMSESQAQREIDLMQSIADDYQLRLRLEDPQADIFGGPEA